MLPWIMSKWPDCVLHQFMCKGSEYYCTHVELLVICVEHLYLFAIYISSIEQYIYMFIYEFSLCIVCQCIFPLESALYSVKQVLIEDRVVDLFLFES